jgi:hypothetical protein
MAATPVAQESRQRATSACDAAEDLRGGAKDGQEVHRITCSNFRPGWAGTTLSRKSKKTQQSPA